VHHQDSIIELENVISVWASARSSKPRFDEFVDRTIEILNAAP